DDAQADQDNSPHVSSLCFIHSHFTISTLLCPPRSLSSLCVFSSRAISFWCFSSSRAIPSLCLRCSRWSFSVSPINSSFCLRAWRSFACLSFCASRSISCRCFWASRSVSIFCFSVSMAALSMESAREGSGELSDRHRNNTLVANVHPNVIRASLRVLGYIRQYLDLLTQRARANPCNRDQAYAAIRFTAEYC